MQTIRQKPLVAMGFTLIELMIAVAIVAILASIAYPSYVNFVVRSNQAEGKTLLMNSAQALERCYTRTNTYVGCLTLPLSSENDWYRITEDSSTFAATTFDLAAVPQGVQATRDTKCGNFILDETGSQTVSASADAAVAQECW